MFERPELGEIALAVYIEPQTQNNEVQPDEFKELCIAAGADLADSIRAAPRTISSKTYIGTGKVEEIEQLVRLHSAELVVFNLDLSPVQERNLEKSLKCRVLSFSGLILAIFAKRALSHEGKCQVELAQLKHMSTRLVRGWTHLERQKGGIGLRGPGEKQLEIDRRLLFERIKAISAKIEKIQQTRELGRRARVRNALPTLSLVGYTNAGKSTLFNHLTGSEVFAKDQLFATLDTTLRQLTLPHMGDAVIADTVGFIRGLPHDLIEAFKATLEETKYSQLLLHVVDASAPDVDDLIFSVNETLKEVGAHEQPVLFVMNKIDLTDESEPRIVRNKSGLPTQVYVSASKQTGFNLLREAISERLSNHVISGMVSLGPQDAALRANLYEKHVVEYELLNPKTHGWDLEIRMTDRQWQSLCYKWPELSKHFIEHEHR